MKKLIRRAFYRLLKGRIIKLRNYNHLNRCKWKINENYGLQFILGNYEKEICTYLLDLNDNVTFLDIGSHSGYLSLFVSKLSHTNTVYSFEPDKSNYMYSKELLHLNNIENWTIENKAVGERSKDAFLAKGVSSSTGFIHNEGELIEMISLDDYFKNYSVPTKNNCFIKIDVEGYGAEVLHGAKDFIGKYTPTILMEIHNNKEFLSLRSSYMSKYKILDFNTFKEVQETNESVSFILAQPKL